MHGFKYWNGKCYTFIKSKLDWEGANDQCKDVSDGKATLVSIHSQEENDYVLSLFIDKGDMLAVWIGGIITYPYVGKGTWIDGTPWNFTNWYPGEPNGEQWGNGSPEAVGMYGTYDGKTPGTWNDVSKGVKLPGLVCSYQPGK